MSGGTADRLRAPATAGRTALWPLPVAAVVLALAAGAALPVLDRTGVGLAGGTDRSP